MTVQTFTLHSIDHLRAIDRPFPTAHRPDHSSSGVDWEVAPPTSRARKSGAKIRFSPVRKVLARVNLILTGRAKLDAIHFELPVKMFQ